MAIWPHRDYSTIPGGKHVRNQPWICAGSDETYLYVVSSARITETRAPPGAPDMFGSTFHDGGLTDTRGARHTYHDEFICRSSI